MSEVDAELMRGVLETGIAHVTLDMAARDFWNLRQYIVASYQTLGMSFADAVKAYAAAEMPGTDPVDLALPLANARVTPARDYRIRLHTDRIDGPIWLQLLAQLGYALGVAGDECYGVDTSWANEPA